MDQIWAPWRAQYIQDTSVRRPTSGCFFCDGLAAESSEDRNNLLVWRRGASAVYLNRFPYNNGHLLIAPRIHAGSLVDFQGSDLQEPLETVQACLPILDRLFRPAGYNIGLNLGSAAGAGIPGHLHWHVVPRWDGDTNFMPVLGGTKVIVESLTAFYDRFQMEISKLA